MDRESWKLKNGFPRQGHPVGGPVALSCSVDQSSHLLGVLTKMYVCIIYCNNVCIYNIYIHIQSKRTEIGRNGEQLQMEESPSPVALSCINSVINTILLVLKLACWRSPQLDGP